MLFWEDSPPSSFFFFSSLICSRVHSARLVRLLVTLLSSYFYPVLSDSYYTPSPTGIFYGSVSFCDSYLYRFFVEPFKKKTIFLVFLSRLLSLEPFGSLFFLPFLVLFISQHRRSSSVAISFCPVSQNTTAAKSKRRISDRVISLLFGWSSAVYSCSFWGERRRNESSSLFFRLFSPCVFFLFFSFFLRSFSSSSFSPFLSVEAALASSLITTTLPRVFWKLPFSLSHALCVARSLSSFLPSFLPFFLSLSSFWIPASLLQPSVPPPSRSPRLSFSYPVLLERSSPFFSFFETSFTSAAEEEKEGG